MSDTAPQFEIVQEIPKSVRTSTAGRERDTLLKQFYEFLTAQPVGTIAKFRSGVHSPNYGGNDAKTRFPRLKMSARQTGEVEGVGRDGEKKMVKVYDLYGEHIEPGAEQKEAGSGEGEGLI